MAYGVTVILSECREDHEELGFTLGALKAAQDQRKRERESELAAKAAEEANTRRRPVADYVGPRVPQPSANGKSCCPMPASFTLAIDNEIGPRFTVTDPTKPEPEPEPLELPRTDYLHQFPNAPQIHDLVYRFTKPEPAAQGTITADVSPLERQATAAADLLHEITETLGKLLPHCDGGPSMVVHVPLRAISLWRERYKLIQKIGN